MKNLTFVVPNFPKAVSLDIRESEFLYNAMVVGNLVSNLVVPGTDGKFSPGMAESWVQEGEDWTFKIRSGHTCENGEPITAMGFRKSLMRAFRSMAKKRDVPVFNQLKGFADFIGGGKDLAGLVAKDENLIFKFNKSPERGFIEYLAFPSLGYACDENFAGNEWKDPNRLISSGAFRLEEFVQGEKVVFRRREGWYRPHPIETVTLLAASPESIKDNATSTILTGADIPSAKPGFVLMKEIPQSLASVNIEPYREMADVNARRILADKIAEVRERTNFDNPLATRTSFFFAGQHTKVVPRPKTQSQFKPKSPLRILVFPDMTLTASRRYMEQVTLTALDELGWPYKIERFVERTMDIISSKDYDIKQFVAEVGSGVEEWIVSMHFCGALGGHYPDPGKQICQITDEMKAKKITPEIYAQKFNQTLYDQASVVPVLSSGNAWLVSEDIDHAITPVMTLPRFDEIVFK